jgi:DNA (cytosine-5)-methyltransferase 1
MMGLPAGHVTDPNLGLPRTAQLRALGNGVVPQQATHATTTLLHLAHDAGAPTADLLDLRKVDEPAEDAAA